MDLRRLRAAASIAIILAMGAAALRFRGAFAEEPMTPEFRRAIGLFLDASPPRRAEGERAIRGLGNRAIPQLRSWLSRSEGDLGRVRGLLEVLAGGPVPADDLLAGVRPFFSREASRAWTAFRAGEFRDAKRTAEAIIQLDPDSPELWQLRRLLRQCEDRLLSKEVLEPTAEFRQLVYGIDENPRLLFRIVNRSRTPISVRADRGILGSIQLSFERRFMDGSERMDERTTTIKTIDGELSVRLQSGESFEQEYPVYVDEPKPAQGMVLRIRATGRFQPSQWNTEETNISRTITMAPAECWLIPPEEKALCEAPLRKLESAHFLRDLHGFFTGGCLAAWAGESDPVLNEGLLKDLIEALGDLDGTGIDVAEPLLEKASGQRRERREKRAGSSPDEAVRFWKAWWALRKKGPGVPEGPRSAVPEGIGR